MSDKESKIEAEVRGTPWFKFLYVEEIKHGRSCGERLEASGPISKDEARKIFDFLFKETFKKSKDS